MADKKEENDGRATIVSKELWEQRMAQIIPSKQDMNQLVMNFLILEGYKEGALKFEKESGIKAEIDHAQIDARIKIRKLILDGKIEEALREINELNSEILDLNPDLLFSLKKQQLIELIKENKLEDAIRFAQTKVAPKCKGNGGVRCNSRKSSSA